MIAVVMRSKENTQNVQPQALVMQEISNMLLPNWRMVGRGGGGGGVSFWLILTLYKLKADYLAVKKTFWHCVVCKA